MNGRWRTLLMGVGGWLAWSACVSGAEAPAQANGSSQRLERLRDGILQEQRLIRALTDRRASLLAQCEAWQRRLTMRQRQLHVLTHAQANWRRAEALRQAELRRQALAVAKIVAAEKHARGRRAGAARALAEAPPQRDIR